MDTPSASLIEVQGPVMGIYDREYYRDKGSGFLGTLVNRGMVCKWLIAANVVAFIIQLATRDQRAVTDGWFTDLFILDPQRVVHGEVWRLITGGFLHSFGILHILFNMLFLWWMGSEVEDIYGPREFCGFYLAALLVSSLAYTALTLAFPVEVRSPVIDANGVMIPEVVRRIYPRALGASGAVTAVMVLFAMHYPRRTVLLFFVIPVPVYLLVVLFILQDTIGLLGGSSQPIAFAGHLGGAAFGFLYGRFQWRVTNWWPSFGSLRATRSRPKLRVFTGEQEPVRPPTVARHLEVDEHLEAELDEVLAKVARVGKGSLSEREQRILMRASEVYRNRRK